MAKVREGSLVASQLSGMVGGELVFRRRRPCTKHAGLRGRDNCNGSPATGCDPPTHPGAGRTTRALPAGSHLRAEDIGRAGRQGGV